MCASLYVCQMCNVGIDISRNLNIELQQTTHTHNRSKNSFTHTWYIFISFQTHVEIYK